MVVLIYLVCMLYTSVVVYKDSKETKGNYAPEFIFVLSLFWPVFWFIVLYVYLVQLFASLGRSAPK
jgi:uncharacterized membrane protein